MGISSYHRRRASGLREPLCLHPTSPRAHLQESKCSGLSGRRMRGARTELMAPSEGHTEVSGDRTWRLRRTLSEGCACNQ